MEDRIQARTNNYPIEELLRRPDGYGFIEERHYNPTHLFIALDSMGKVYELLPEFAKKGPAITRIGGPRGTCDERPMMYVKEDGAKFLYQSALRPGRANPIQTCTKANLSLEERMVREYVQWRGGEHLYPKDTKLIGSHMCKDDGGIRYE